MSPPTAARYVPLLAMFSLTAVGAATPSRPRKVLPVPEYIPQEAQTELKARMSQHAAIMGAFVEAVVLLDRPAIRSLSRPIAEEEVIGSGNGPMSERTRLLLPQDFFLEQVALNAIARQLAVAAERGDDEGVSDRLAALSRTCVGCHSSYLHRRPGS
jgi:hypothetical protein